MNYDEALDYLLGLTDYEKSAGYSYAAENFDLRRMDELLCALGNPHLSAKSIHVAGTKGKGSTASMIASILQMAGYKIGLFTSPHLHTFRERIQVDGRLIQQDELARLVTRMYPAAETVQKSATFGRLTTFELATALAFLYFDDQKVDYQVLETGLGGRLDATNVVRPLVSVITSISLDHTSVLGNTLEEIATEKSGIIKPGVPIVSAPQQEEAARTIARIAHEKGSRLIAVGEAISYTGIGNTGKGQQLRIKTAQSEYDVEIPLLGEYQGENAANAIAAIEVVRDAGAHITDDSIRRGLSQVKWPGRLQILQRNPLVVIDGAHNVYSARKLREALDAFFEYSHYILVFGASYDKDIPGILEEIGRGCQLAVTVRSQHPRAADPESLSTELAKHGIPSVEAEDVASAIRLAISKASPQDLICITGSLFVVGEAIEAYETVEMD